MHDRALSPRWTRRRRRASAKRMPTITPGGSEAAPNPDQSHAARNLDQSRAAGVVLRADPRAAPSVPRAGDAENPKVAAVPKVAAAGAVRKLAAAGAVPKDVAPSPRNRRHASKRTRSRLTVSNLILAPVAGDASIASKRTRSKLTASNRIPGSFPRASRNVNSIEWRPHVRLLLMSQ